jgi:hypothetical protein
MGVFDGVQETFTDLWTEIRKITVGYTPAEKEATKKDGEKVKERIESGVPWYDAPIKTITGIDTTQGQAIFSWLIVGLLIFLLIRD